MMSTCIKCNTAGSSSEPLTSCDRCEMSLCKSCASLTTTELRAIALQKRSISFFCSECREAQLQPSPNGFVDLKRTICDLIRGEFSSLVDDIAGKICTELQPEMNSIRNEVAALRESNVDLIRLLTEGPMRLPRSAEDSVVSACESGESLPQPSLVTQGKKTDIPVRGCSGQLVEVSAVPMPGLRKSVRESSTSARQSTQRASGTHGTLQSGTSGTQPSSAAQRIRQSRFSAIVGSRKMSDPAVASIAAAKIQKKTSIYVGKLDPSVTGDDLLAYLKSTFGLEETFTLEEQKVKSGDYRAFKVEARLDLLGQLLCAANWPEEIVVKRFRFPHRKTSTSN